jgi:hypothetical protein
MKSKKAGECELGERVFLDESCGTIKYRGPLQGKQGEYVGIEWDSLQVLVRQGKRVFSFFFYFFLARKARRTSGGCAVL